MRFAQPAFKLVLFVAALCAISSEVFANAVLVEKGQSRSVIYVAARVMAEDVETRGLDEAKRREEGDRQRLRASVNDLAHYLGKMSGAAIEVVEGKPDANAKQTPILIGELATGKWGMPKKSAPLKQAFRVVVTDDALGLGGESDLATSYAIYELLDRLGCRWYMPSELGEVIPTQKTITLKTTDESLAPYTIYRGIWYADDDYKRRNRLGGLLLSAGHALEGYISPKQREEHPEWVGTVDGKPQKRRLRWSAAGLPEAIADHIIERLDKTPGTVSISLSPDDGLGYDNSKEDLALDAGDFDPSIQAISMTDRGVWFSNQIVERVAEKNPDVLFGLLAYAVTTRPPVREKLHPNLVPQIAPITYSRAHPMTHDGEPNNKDFRYLVEGWGKAAETISYYFYGYFLAAPSAPNPFITKWGVNLPIVFKNNCKMWQPETITNFETAMHAHYMGLRLAWNPDQDPQDIVNELHEKFYGNAASQMNAYWRHIDKVWIETLEYSGCGFGHMRRFTPERLSQARYLMYEAVRAAKTPEEKFRVGIADDSLRLFELFMKLRQDQADGNFSTLAEDAKKYRELVIELSTRYEEQYAFGKMGWTRGDSLYGRYFGAFYQRTYDDASRIAQEYDILTKPPVREWKYQADQEKQGESKKWQAVDFDDSEWKTTDVATETWSSLGYHNYMGSMWYRTEVNVPKVPVGKKQFLWVGSTDGRVKVFVNGKAVSYTDDKGETADSFVGYCKPASFDITSALKPGELNQISLFCTREFINELGTGGLLAPVVIYREK